MLKASFFFLFYFFMFLDAFVNATEEQDLGFLAIVDDSLSEPSNVLDSENSIDNAGLLIENKENVLTEEEIEQGFPGCFNRYAYGINAKDFGLSSVGISCPNPSKYKLIKGECSFIGEGRISQNYSYQNFHYCSSQGIKKSKFHRTIAIIRCCSNDDDEL